MTGGDATVARDETGFCDASFPIEKILNLAVYFLTLLPQLIVEALEGLVHNPVAKRSIVCVFCYFIFLAIERSDAKRALKGIFRIGHTKLLGRYSSATRRVIRVRSEPTFDIAATDSKNNHVLMFTRTALNVALQYISPLFVISVANHDDKVHTLMLQFATHIWYFAPAKCATESALHRLRVGTPSLSQKPASRAMIRASLHAISDFSCQHFPEI